MVYDPKWDYKRNKPLPPGKSIPSKDGGWDNPDAAKRFARSQAPSYRHFKKPVYNRVNPITAAAAVAAQRATGQGYVVRRPIGGSK
jgi:hypothetical protein